MKRPPVRYVRSEDGAYIAYSSVGAGDQDYCIILPSLGTIEVLGEPPARRMVEGIAKHTRLISFDRRGAGLSDPVAEPATLEEQMADVTAVLDACGSDRVVIEAQAEAAMLAVVFAATHPERVSHLILMHPMARMTARARLRVGLGRRGDSGSATSSSRCSPAGEPGRTAPRLHRSLTNTNPEFIDWWGRWERLSSSPGTMQKRMDLVAKMDVREILPRVQAPSLIIDRPLARAMDSRHAKYFAENIPGAVLAELPGRDAISFGEGSRNTWTPSSSSRPAASPSGGRSVRWRPSCSPTSSARRSSPPSSATGGWRETLERHDRLTRDLVQAYGGRAIKSTGDGFLATFDGPARAVRCAKTIGQRVGDLGIELRAGLHTGEVEVIGSDVGGMAVHIGARIGALGEPGEVLVSSTVRDLVVGSGIEFAPRGTHELKGVPGEWNLYEVTSADR